MCKCAAGPGSGDQDGASCKEVASPQLASRLTPVWMTGLGAGYQQAYNCGNFLFMQLSTSHSSTGAKNKTNQNKNFFKFFFWEVNPFPLFFLLEFIIEEKKRIVPATNICNLAMFFDFLSDASLPISRLDVSCQPHLRATALSAERRLC